MIRRRAQEIDPSLCGYPHLGVSTVGADKGTPLRIQPRTSIFLVFTNTAVVGDRNEVKGCLKDSFPPLMGVIKALHGMRFRSTVTVAMGGRDANNDSLLCVALVRPRPRYRGHCKTAREVRVSRFNSSRSRQ